MISKLLREIREAKEAKEQGIINDEEFNFLKDQALSRLLPEGQEFYSGNLEGIIKADFGRRPQYSIGPDVYVDKKDLSDLAEKTEQADIDLKPFNVNRQMGKLAEYLEDIGFGGPGVDPVATVIHLLERSGFNATGQGQQPKYDFDIADFEEVKNQIGRYDYISNTRGLDSELKVEGLFFAEDFQILADHLRAVAGDQE